MSRLVFKQSGGKSYINLMAHPSNEILAHVFPYTNLHLDTVE